MSPCFKQKTDIFLVTRPPTWLLYKTGQKKDKSEFASTFVGIIVTIIFTSKYLSNCE